VLSRLAHALGAHQCGYLELGAQRGECSLGDVAETYD
jgi:hypothetical protein